MLKHTSASALTRRRFLRQCAGAAVAFSLARPALLSAYSAPGGLFEEVSQTKAAFTGCIQRANQR